jgi:hypothetical protein
MRVRTGAGVCGVVLVLAWLGLVPAAASALPVVQSVAEAWADESGDAPGTDFDSDQTSDPGESVQAHAARCPGSGSCAYNPQLWDSVGAHARARTDFGSNRARVHANSGPEGVQNDVVDGAYASSLWVDEWSFFVPLQSLGQAVTIDIQLDGAWQNTAGVRFEAAVADTTLPPFYNPDDPNPFLDLDAGIVSVVGFDNTAEFAHTGVSPFFILVPDGGEPDGSVDLTLTLSFVPVPGRTYLVGARLVLETHGQESDEAADFESTAAVTRVLLPAGVSLTSTGAYTLAVPEPGAALLLAAAAGALALARLRELP